MTIAVDLGRKATKQTNKQTKFVHKIGQMLNTLYEIKKTENGDISLLLHKLTVHA